MLVLVALAGGGAFLVSLVFTCVVRSFARRMNFVDRPGGHKQHIAPVALGGGIAIAATILFFLVCGTLAARWLHRFSPLPDWLPTLVHVHLSGIASKLPVVLAVGGGILVLHVVGLIDDINPLGWKTKLAVQLLVAILVAGPGGIRAVEFLPAPLSIALTVFWIVVITNAFNFLDNMDGLSAGVASICCAIFGVASAAGGQIFVPVMAWVGAGACLGFLMFNFHPASVFMGDAGSLVIGFFLAVLTVLTTYYDSAFDPTPLGVIVPLLVLAVPLYDVTSVVTHRIRAGQSPFHADRRHFSHRLITRGMTVRGTVLTIYLATAATGLPAIILPHLDWPAALLILLQCLCVVAIIAILESTKANPTNEVTKAQSATESFPARR
jgi:UDP-GlcNAc:undecaprenyl-phosphate GlcNAc-1-phosphate transferase